MADIKTLTEQLTTLARNQAFRENFPESVNVLHEAASTLKDLDARLQEYWKDPGIAEDDTVFLAADTSGGKAPELLPYTVVGVCPSGSAYMDKGGNAATWNYLLYNRENDSYVFAETGDIGRTVFTDREAGEAALEAEWDLDTEEDLGDEIG